MSPGMNFWLGMLCGAGIASAAFIAEGHRHDRRRDVENIIVVFPKQAASKCYFFRNRGAAGLVVVDSPTSGRITLQPGQSFWEPGCSDHSEGDHSV